MLNQTIENHLTASQTSRVCRARCLWELFSLSAAPDTHSFRPALGWVARLPTGTLVDRQAGNDWVQTVFKVRVSAKKKVTVRPNKASKRERIYKLCNLDKSVWNNHI